MKRVYLIALLAVLFLIGMLIAPSKKHSDPEPDMDEDSRISSWSEHNIYVNGHDVVFIQANERVSTGWSNSSGIDANLQQKIQKFLNNAPPLTCAEDGVAFSVACMESGKLQETPQEFATRSITYLKENNIWIFYFVEKNLLFYRKTPHARAFRMVIDAKEMKLMHFTWLPNPLPKPYLYALGDRYQIIHMGTKYICQLFDKNHNIIEEYVFHSDPTTNQIAERIICISAQFGTGRSTNLGIFCKYDADTVIVEYPWVLNYTEDLVVLGDKDKVIIRSIFDDSFYKEITKFSQPLAQVADSIIAAEFIEDGVAVSVTYVVAETFEQISETFYIR